MCITQQSAVDAYCCRCPIFEQNFLVVEDHHVRSTVDIVGNSGSWAVSLPRTKCVDDYYKVRYGNLRYGRQK